ncbi:MAG: phospholipid/cholesterol/gamma-HCH transport system substrate-binding protein [Thermoleophilaceae bacterium]|nr:phospholipid/cholesterol/gamma-HCH transport system substrate-binding protein [Thermoleophilaceae bacterium]
MTVAAVVLATLVLAWLLFGSGSPYEVSLTLDNASQLVEGNQVKVGGVAVGSVDSIELGADGRARVRLSIDDGGVTPLHTGSRAAVRSASLSGVANRYVALTPGPVSGGEIADGGAIPAEDTSAEVDLDELLNTLDPTTLRDLKALVRGGADGLQGRGKELGRAIETLDPALSQITAVEQEILRDEDTFTRFLVESADVVSAVASRPARLEGLIAHSSATLDELAARDVSLDSLLRRAPATLRQANTTLVNLRSTLRDVDPALVEARPAAPLLAGFLERLRPVAQRARPVVSQLRTTIDHRGSDDLLGVLAGVPPLERAAVPAFESVVATVNDALPVVNEVRPYTPDVVGGLFNGFGGTTAGYYDANGRYTRISFQSNAYSLQGVGSLLPVPGNAPGLTGYRKNVTRRCPGAATQPAPDGSNPWLIGEPTCSAGDSP